MPEVEITEAAAAAFPIFSPGGPREPIKREFQRVHSLIERDIPPGRARSIALTHLETAGMYAVKAIFQGEK